MVVQPEVYFQDGHCRHLAFRKTAAISLVFDPSSTKFSGNIRTSIWNISMPLEMHINKIQDDRRLEFLKTAAISLLFYQSLSNFVGILLL